MGMLNLSQIPSGSMICCWRRKAAERGRATVCNMCGGAVCMVMVLGASSFVMAAGSTKRVANFVDADTLLAADFDFTQVDAKAWEQWLAARVPATATTATAPATKTAKVQPG